IRVNKPLNLLRRTVRLAGVFAAYRALGGTAVVATMGDPKVFKNGRRTEGFSRNVRRAAPTAPCGAIGDARRRSMTIQVTANRRRPGPRSSIATAAAVRVCFDQ